MMRATLDIEYTCHSVILAARLKNFIFLKMDTNHVSEYITNQHFRYWYEHWLRGISISIIIISAITSHGSATSAAFFILKIYNYKHKFYMFSCE